ncbi:MAG: peptide transporter ATPase [Ilumatobacteraceae bacterium]|nr:peptide transporter ATPase [Ilumatobacteraceae bacterium]
MNLAADDAILTADAIGKTFGRGTRANVAVQPTNVSFRRGRSIGIAGESGSGKSTLLRLLLGLEAPTAGAVRFEGMPIASLTRAEHRRYRATVQAVFQDPGGSLDPRLHIWQLITEPAWATGGLTRRSRRELAARLLHEVDLPERFADRLPHQLSGGERQRVAIARAVSSSPQLVLLDEPVTSLDVSVRGAIINLLADRGAELTYAVVSHDLTVIAHLTDELLIMYQGFVVERGPTDAILDAPRHPYSQALVAAVHDPLHDTGYDSDVPAGAGACPFINRCPFAMEQCVVMPDPVGQIHQVRCHLYSPDDGEDTTRGAPPLGSSDPIASTVNVTGAHQ